MGLPLPDDVDDTLRRVFGDGDMHPDIVGEDVEACIVHSEYRERLIARPSAPALRVVRSAPPPPLPPRMDPRFVRMMTAPDVSSTAPQAVLDAKTWLHAATHAPSDARAQLLLQRAVGIVAALLGVDLDGS